MLPDVDLSDPYLDAGVPQRMHVPVKQEASPDGTKSRSKLSLVKSHQDEDRETDSLLESMVENTGSLDLDDQGHWDFHGQSSGLVFLRRMRDEFGDLMSQSEGAGLPFLKTQRLLADKSPRAIGYSPPESSLPNIRDLPRQECAQLLCAYALDDACALVRFVHQPWFYRMVDRIYSVPPEQFGKDENRFLPLLYATLALGCLFAKQEQSQLQIKGYEGAIDQGQVNTAAE